MAHVWYRRSGSHWQTNYDVNELWRTLSVGLGSYKTRTHRAHRDIQPKNIIVYEIDTAKKKQGYKIINFGQAAYDSQQKSGDPLYWHPDTIGWIYGNDAILDIYSSLITIFEVASVKQKSDNFIQFQHAIEADFANWFLKNKDKDTFKACQKEKEKEEARKKSGGWKSVTSPPNSCAFDVWIFYFEAQASSTVRAKLRYFSIVCVCVCVYVYVLFYFLFYFFFLFLFFVY